MKCAATTLSSKLVAHQKGFFAKLVVDAVMVLDDLLPLNMIGIKKVQGGALEVSPPSPSCITSLITLCIHFDFVRHESYEPNTRSMLFLEITLCVCLMAGLAID
jgi:hypothetical protein